MGSESKISRIIKTIGPGILFAGAAIGGSHLIQSTRAGAGYGFSLLWIVILANFFKYPFFEYGYRYTSATGKSILEGYRDLGKWALYSFFGLSIVTGVANTAALAIVTSGLANFLFGTAVNPFHMSIAFVSICLIILILGKYPLLDKVIKFMILLLAISTTIAFVLAVGEGSQAQPGYTAPDLLNDAGIAFVIALMGWMPAPIEASVWTSLWALGREKQTKQKSTLKESLVDFHIGYIGTTILAIFFLSLGALIMFGTGEQFADKGADFAAQLCNLYTIHLGDWSLYIIATAAILTLFSSLITVMDGYPRSYSSILNLMTKDKSEESNYYWMTMVAMSVLSLIIVGYLTRNMRQLIDLATILSFLAAPLFAIINLK
jgi:Mn2+/Fe2+ NRAMP family transporter